MAIEVEYDPDDPVGNLLSLYRTYDWWADRTEDDIGRALRHTDALVVLRDGDSGAAVAAARVLTDHVYYAMVYDVIVTEGRRGEGVGQQLIEAVVDHPELSETRTLSLLSREGLVPFYESCGFVVGDEEVAHPEGSPEPLRWLRYRPD